MAIIRLKNYESKKEYKKLIVNYYLIKVLCYYYAIGFICLLYYVINCYN